MRQEGESFGETMKHIAVDIGDAFLQMAGQIMVRQAMVGMLGQGTFNSLMGIPAPAPSAKGNVVAGGKIKKFAYGGVYYSPQTYQPPPSLTDFWNNQGYQMGGYARYIRERNAPGLQIAKKNPISSGFLRHSPMAKLLGFADGGIVDKPTLFPMRDGTGLMGEAGPEGILPLERIGGKLGVNALVAGGSQAPPVVTVNIVNQGQPLKQSGPPRISGNEIDVMVENVLAKSYDQGGLMRDIMEGRRG